MKQCKRIISMLLIWCMVVALLPAAVFAAEIVDSGTCGDNLSWRLESEDFLLDSKRTLVISGNGEIPDYSIGSAVPPWYHRGWHKNWTNNIKNVIIDYGVTTIGNQAFVRYPTGSLDSIRNITMPDSLTTIGNYAFQGCDGITSLIIPESVTHIGCDAFCDCFNLKSISLPKNITSIEEGTFRYCSRLSSVILSNNVIYIGSEAFSGCTALTDVYYSGSEEQWDNIYIGSYNDALTSATIHYNSTGPDDVDPGDDTSTSAGSVHFLNGWNEETRNISFNSDQVSPYFVAESVDTSGISDMVGKYVLVTTNPDSPLEVTGIQPVESKIGTCSAVNGRTMTIDGVDYTVPEHWIIIDIYAGKEILYHICDGVLVGADTINEKEGVLQSYDSSAGTIVVDRKEYHTNFLTDVNSLKEISQNIGKIVHFHTAGINTTYPLLIDVIGYSVNPSALGKFILYADTPTTCIEKGKNFEIYVGYYKNDTLDSSVKDYVCVVSDNSVFEAIPNGWNNEHGQRYIISAKNTGYSTITITNPKNDDAVSLELYVVEGENGYTFSGVPKMTVEEGKTTNFYNYNGMVIDEFTATPLTDSNGNITKYTVKMTVYNTLNLYGAVTAFDADGNTKGFYLIDKMPTLPSSFTKALEELYNQTGNFFFTGDTINLMKNERFYSGKSISKKTDVTIEVPAGGYLEISNSAISPIVAIANTTDVYIQSIKLSGELASNAGKLTDEITYEVVKDVLNDLMNFGPVGKKTIDAIKDAAIDELKNANWNHDNYMESLLAFTERLNAFKINLLDTISKKIASVTGVLSITESVIKKVIPTGKIINFLFGITGIMDEGVLWENFLRSINFPKGIYIYAPSSENSYKSNGVNVTPDTSTNPNTVVHAYLVIDESELEIPSDMFDGSYETYNITMYRDGKKIQPDSSVTVRIPLSDNFKLLDKSKLKVYRHNDDGTITNMNATIEDGYAVFSTNHFSYYSIVVETTSQPPADKHFTVIFNANGGFGDTTVITNIDGKLSSLPTPIRSGYTFDGWFTSADGGSKITTDTVFSANSTVYAHWTYNNSELPTQPKFTITFDPTGGTVSPVSDDTNETGKLSVFPTPIRSGYTFDGWFTSIDGGSKITTDTVFNANTTVYAHWTYIGGGSSGGNGSSSSSGGGGGGSSSSTNSISVPNTSGGKVSVNPTKASAGIKVTISTIPDPGYDLDKIIVTDNNGNEIKLADAGNGKYTFTMPNSKVSIAATFRQEDNIWSNPFTDVAEGKWYYNAVKFVSENSLMSGYGNGIFAPDANLTRAMLVQILYNKAGKPDVTYNGIFTDVASDTWYANAVIWAEENGIVSGYGNNLFGPNDNITREQLAVILWRYAGNPAATDKELSFTDSTEVSGYAVDSLKWAVKNGIISGYGNGILDPKGYATRAQIAQILKNYFEK